MPTTTPEKVAAAVVSAIHTNKATVDIPGYLPLLYRVYAMAPRTLQRLSAACGWARRDFSTPPSHRVLPPLWRIVGTNRTIVKVMATLSPSVDRVVHRLSNGRSTAFGHVLPTLMLDTVGSQTGQQRRTPVAYAQDDDGSVLVVGSNFGRPNHPAWSTNLLKTPAANMILDGNPTPVHAKLLTSPDREQAWLVLLRVWPFTVYADRCERELRIFRLTPLLTGRPRINHP